ncbi:type II toxin-antitoxin system Phd/YefM family antitoxin [Arthrobacter monumenti]
MATVGVRDLRNRTADLVARAHAGEEIIITNHGAPAARLEPVVPGLKPFMTKSDLLSLPLADPGLKDDLAVLAGDTTEDLGPIR